MSQEDFFSRIRSYFDAERGSYGDVAYHRRSYREFLGDYRQHVARCRSGNDPDELQRVEQHLFEWASDTRNLYAAWRWLATHGSHAPGPNGVTWGDLSTSEAWAHIRFISRVLREGQYRHGKVRKKRLPKATGLGSRTIQIADIPDRVVARAVHQILQPWLECSDTPFSCCRSGRGTYYALAVAEILTRRSRRFMWGSQDLQDAFDNVPQRRLLDIVRLRVPCAQLTDLVQELLRPAGSRGVGQGSCLAPLLFGYYCEHFIDRPWRARVASVPLIRYADDLLLLATSVDSFDDLYDQLSAITIPAGFKLKIPTTEMFVDVREKPLRWLGYQCSWQNNRLVKRPAYLSFDDNASRHELMDGLKARFIRLHEGDAAYRRAPWFVEGLLAHAGPGFKDSDRKAAYEVVCDAGRCAGFEELISFAKFEAQWRRAFERWKATVKRVKYLLPAGASAPCVSTTDSADRAEHKEAPF